MLADLDNYVRWWHSVFLLLLAGWWIVGGGVYLFKALRTHIGRKARMGRSIGVMILSLASAVFVAGVLAWALRSFLGSSVAATAIAGIVAAAGAIATAVLVVHALHSLALGASVRLAVPALLGCLALAVVMAGASAPSALATRSDLRQRVSCQSNLVEIYKALRKEQVSSLQELKKKITLDVFACPADGKREIGYFFYEPAMHGSGNPSPLVLCDLAPNHFGGRDFITSNGVCNWMPEEQFQQMLKNKENADFAAALAKAQGK